MTRHKSTRLSPGHSCSEKAYILLTTRQGGETEIRGGKGTTCIMGAVIQKLRTPGMQHPLESPTVIQKFQAGKSRTFPGSDPCSHGQSVQSCSFSDFSECFLLFGPQKDSTLRIWPRQPPPLNP